MDRFSHATDRSSERMPLVRTYVQHIGAPPEIVFPLLCPVREGAWLEGWADGCELIWSRSGVAERGCVFRTSDAGLPDTTWIVTDHDPDRGVVVLARVTPGLVATTVRLEVCGTGDGSSTVAIRYEVVPTTDEGEAFAAARYEPSAFLATLVWWERSMNHYLRTGQMLRRAAER